MKLSDLSESWVTQRNHVSTNPKGSACWQFILRYRPFIEAHSTSWPLPCLNHQQTAAKTHSKDQHALASSVMARLPLIPSATPAFRSYTLLTWRCLVVNCTHSPHSLSGLSSWGWTRLSPTSSSNYFGYIPLIWRCLFVEYSHVPGAPVSVLSLKALSAWGWSRWLHSKHRQWCWV